MDEITYSATFQAEKDDKDPIVVPMGNEGDFNHFVKANRADGTEVTVVRYSDNGKVVSVTAVVKVY